MGRIIGIDWGSKRIGLAVTDPLQIFASPLITVSQEEFDRFIAGYLETHEVDAFVIGYPVQMNNRPGASVKYINAFVKKLNKTYPEKAVFLADERFTSQMAARAMVEGGVKKKDRQDKSMVDKISASIILRSFLDTKSKKTENFKLK